MLSFVFHQSLVSGRLLCPRCQRTMDLRFVSNLQSHYETLGIAKSASQAEIKSAFLTRSKRLHPDINQEDPKNHEKFVKLNEAYMVLSKPISRREYDLNLAARIQMNRQARSAASSHVYGSSPWPGSNYEENAEAEQQRFWDETIWYMRDKSKDQEFEGQPYYGFVKMDRVANSYIVLGCVAVVLFGIVAHYIVISKSRELHKTVLDNRDKVSHSHLQKSRSLAKANGNALQIEILRSKVEKTPLQVEGVSEETVRDAFMPVNK